MAESVGLGFLLNILFWTLAVLVAVGLASLAVLEYFPGREHKTRKGAHRSRTPAAETRVGPHDAGKRYRKAS